LPGGTKAERHPPAGARRPAHTRRSSFRSGSEAYFSFWAMVKCRSRLGSVFRRPLLEFGFVATRPGTGASRSSDEWSESDYDGLADGVVVGRIMRITTRHSFSPNQPRAPSCQTREGKVRFAPLAHRLLGILVEGPPFKMSAVGSLSVSQRGMTDNAFSRRAGHASISTLDVRTGRLQWGGVVHWRGHHKIEHTLEASLRQVRPRRLGGCHLPAGRLSPR
jgi:hypothetical protein